MLDEKALARAVKRAMENAGMLPAKEAVKLVPADWHRICDLVLNPQQALSPGSTGEAEGCSPISDEPLEALSHARTTAANDDTSTPGTVERKRHCQRLAAMQSATAEIVKLRALLSAAGER